MLSRRILFRVLAIVLIVLILLVGYAALLSVRPAPATYSIIMWNIEVFGTTKASNTTLLEEYAAILVPHDIIIIQEIRDASQEAFFALCAYLPDHECFTSARAGRSSSKEQYGFMLKDIQLIAFIDREDDRFERPPATIIVNLSERMWEITTLHAKPSDVPAELRALEELIPPDGFNIIIGDLNADCRYLHDPDAYLRRWIWIIDEPTTTTGSGCAYDRILVSPKARRHIVEAYIERGTERSHSDHHPVAIVIG